MSRFADLFDAPSKDEPESKDSKVDHLREDPLILDQKYVIFSFAEPRPSMLEQRELFILRSFTKWFYEQQHFRLLMNVQKQFLADCPELEMTEEDKNKFLFRFGQFLSTYPFSENLVERQDDLTEKELVFSSETIATRYEDFRRLNFDRLMSEFAPLSKNQLFMHGVKFRGAFSSLEEVQERVKLLKEQKIEPYVDVFAAEGFKWIPRNPYPNDDAMKISYDEEQEQLNALLGGKKANEAERDRQFEKRKAELMKGVGI